MIVLEWLGVHAFVFDVDMMLIMKVKPEGDRPICTYLGILSDLQVVLPAPPQEFARKFH